MDENTMGVAAIRARLYAAYQELVGLRTLHDLGDERSRISGKIEGIDLALGYIDEYLRAEARFASMEMWRREMLAEPLEAS